MASITLYKGIPWGPDGLHVLRFPNKNAQTSFFSNWVQKVTKDVNYDPRRTAILNIDMNWMEASEYNYLSWTDGTYTLYYFLIEAIKLNDTDVSTLSIQEDIWQNSHLDISVLPGRVHRRHMPRWSGNTPLLYPIDEGNPRTMRATTIKEVTTDPTHTVIMFITSKSVGDNPKDSINYYFTAISNNGISLSPSTAGGFFISPFESFTDNWAKTGTATSDIVGCVVIPYFPWVTFPNPLQADFDLTKGGLIRFPSLTPGEGYTSILYGVNTFAGIDPVTLPVNIPKPTKSSNATWENEPMVFSDNFSKIVITDANGNPLITIPKDIAWQVDEIQIEFELFSLQPQLRINYGGSVADGTSVIIPCPQIDVPTSKWIDYAVQSRAQDKQILQNNIETNRTNTMVSAISGAFLGGAVAGGVVGIAGAGVQLGASLLQSTISERNEWSNFALNEQKIKNSSSPPIGGSNFESLVNQGVKIVNLVGDDISRDLIYKNYLFHGVIVDSDGEIPLRTRKYYDFIQTSNASVNGDTPGYRRSFIASLLDAGVTIWHYENYQGIGNYSLDNTEV